MHYEGVSSTRSTRASTRPDPLDPIVQRYLRSGDEEAMDRLVERTRPKLMAVARRIGDPQDAEDAVQGAYMALVRKRASGLDAPVMPWLLTTVIRLAYRRKAKQRRQRDLAAHLAQPRDGAAVAPVPTEPADLAPDRRALDAERDLHLRDQVARLPSLYRDAVVLRHLEGLTTRDTAALLDVPEATLRTRLHRAAKLLRSRMAPALLASLLFLPWCAADAVRRLVPITRPLATKAAALYATAGLAVVAGLAWMIDAPATSSGSAAHRSPESAGTGAVAGDPPPAPPVPVEEERPDDEAATTPEDERVRAPKPVEPTRPDGKDAQEPVNGAVPPDALEPGRTAPRPLPPIVDIASDAVELPEPPGMVFLEGGPVTIGTEPEALATLLAGRPALFREKFAYETPRHDVRVPSYWIARYEVTNAQYLRFLEDHRVTHTTRPGGLETLERVASDLLSRGHGSEAAKRRGAVAAWRQLYEGNRGAIWKAFSKAGRNLLVLRADGTADLEATAQRARREPLPAGLTLSFYRYAPPPDWPGLRPATDRMDHPVRGITYNDAERMATWAGMHVPTGPEWEWAARGPDGRRFPWGDAWVPDASHANWGAQVTDARREPTTLAVDTLAKGRSWCGAHHMSGNVAEWTSSWFRAYPGSKAEPHKYMGRWVKVIRGGSAADMEPIFLRPAARNFLGGGASAPPYPDNGFRLVGFRLAVYQQPARDHVAPLIRRVANGHVKTEALDAARFAGFVQRDWHDADAEVPHHVYVRGRTTAVVFVPVTYLLRDEAAPLMREAWAKPAAFRDAGGRRRRLATDDPFFVVGALQLDLPLESVEVADPRAAKRRRGSARAPATRPGRCEPGTYLVTLWHGRVALTTPTREFVCFLPPRGPKIPSVEVRPRSSERLGPPTLKPSLEADEGGLDFTVPLGGKRAGDKHVVHVRAALPYAREAFDAAHARGFLRSTDGR